MFISLSATSENSYLYEIISQSLHEFLGGSEG